MKNLYTYTAFISRVIDGDTVEAVIDLGFNLTFTGRFTIMNLDTPEVYRPKNDAEKLHGLQASAFAKELLLNKTVTIKTHKKVGIYGRYLAKIILSDCRIFSDVMIEQGYQKKKSY